jgi:hypothetical protein
VLDVYTVTCGVLPVVTGETNVGEVIVTPESTLFVTILEIAIVYLKL